MNPNDEIEREIEEEEQEEEEEEKRHEIFKHLQLTCHTIVCMLHEFTTGMHRNRIQYPLSWRPKTSYGYDYIHKILKEDPEEFRQLHRIYPSVFLKLCGIIREKTLLQDTRFICIEEMLATFLLIVGQNSRYCQTRKTFGRSHFTTSKNFNKMLIALNKLSVDMMAKPSPSVSEKIRGSTRFYPYFKVRIIFFGD